MGKRNIRLRGFLINRVCGHGCFLRLCGDDDVVDVVLNPFGVGLLITRVGSVQLKYHQPIKAGWVRMTWFIKCPKAEKRRCLIVVSFFPLDFFQRFFQRASTLC
jgi:hypothetical protein